MTRLSGSADPFPHRGAGGHERIVEPVGPPFGRKERQVHDDLAVPHGDEHDVEPLATDAPSAGLLPADVDAQVLGRG